MASQKLVINELLAFVQNALKDNDLDQYSIVKTCENNFTAEEINKATTLLFQLQGKDQKPSRQGCLQNLLDIIDFFENTSVANVPVFVAKQLNKLPLVLFERPSIQKLVSEIHFLKGTLVEMQSKLVAVNNDVNELCEQVYMMHRAELKQCWSKGISNKDTDEVKSASNDSKLVETPRPAPRTSLSGKVTSRPNVLTPKWPSTNNSVNLSELNLEVDKDGFVRVKI